MYNGINKKRKKLAKIKFPTEFEMLQTEEEIVNGIITKKLVVKTISRLADRNISYRDFEVNNLLAAGIDVRSQPATYLSPSIDQINENAEMAINVIDYEQYMNEQVGGQNNEA